MSEATSQKRWTVATFCDLLKRHGAGGWHSAEPHIDASKPCFVLVKGFINLEALVEELNGEGESR